MFNSFFLYLKSHVDQNCLVQLTLQIQQTEFQAYFAFVVVVEIVVELVVVEQVHDVDLMNQLMKMNFFAFDPK